MGDKIFGIPLIILYVMAIHIIVIAIGTEIWKKKFTKYPLLFSLVIGLPVYLVAYLLPEGMKQYGVKGFLLYVCVVAASTTSYKYIIPYKKFLRKLTGNEKN